MFIIGRIPCMIDSKRRALDRYNAKCDYIAIKPRKEHGMRIREAAKASGMSLQGYILEAIAEKMARDVTPSVGR